MTRHPFVAPVAIASVTFALAALAVWIGRRLLSRSLATFDSVQADNRTAVESRARQFVGALKLLAYGVAAVASISLALPSFGVAASGWSPRDLLVWIGSHGLRVVAIVAGAYLTVRAAHLAIERLQHRARGGLDSLADQERTRRTATLGGILSNLVTVVVGFIAGLMVLRELSIDIVPIVTGAGIAGLAVGFGAQNLVRDVIAGFFLILENQLRVGDSARINGVGGVVEEINLRTTVLRDIEGAVHIIPNGSIAALANLSKDFSYALVDVAVAPGEDLDRVTASLRDIGEQMQRDRTLGSLLLAPIEVLGLESLGETQVTIRTRFKTAPLKQGEIVREVRRRVVSEFAARGIETSRPATMVVQRARPKS